MVKGFTHDLNGCADSSGNEANSLGWSESATATLGAALTFHRISKGNLLMAAQGQIPWDNE